MTKPGLARAIPFSIIGFVLGIAIVIILRALQSVEPVWDPGVAIVLAPWTTVYFFLWGMGAFNPKMSEHGDHAHDHEEEEEEAPFTSLRGVFWQVATISILVMLILFIAAMLPTGLRLDTVNDPGGDVAAIGFDAGTGGEEADGVSQLTVFGIFIAITFISLLVASGIIAFLFYFLNGQMKAAEGEPSEADLKPPSFLRPIGNLLNWIAGLLRGIPSFLGVKE